MTEIQSFRAEIQEYTQIPKEAAVPVGNQAGQMCSFPDLSHKAYKESYGLSCSGDRGISLTTGTNR